MQSRKVSPGKASALHFRQFPVMGTLGKITLYGLSPEKAAACMDAAQLAMYEVEKLCSIFDRQSPLSVINRTAADQFVPCPEELFQLLSECGRYYVSSQGAFDVTVRPLMQLWGFYRKRRTLPDEKEIRKTLERVSWDLVTLDAESRRVFFRKKGVSLDLGGIAKGYALDKAARTLDRLGVKKFMLDLGGNLFCRNTEKNDAPFRVGIRHPEQPGKIWKYIKIRNGAVATSGNYERCVIIDGKRYTHIMDPRNGKVVENMLSVTVVTPRGIDSDALSTTCFVLGKIPEKIPPDTQVFIFRKDSPPEETIHK